jgi:molybdopterin-guanine dinucleotide biosynthesis protein A
MAAAILKGLVLTGGRSQRMGTDKALLPAAAGDNMLDQTVALLQALIPDVYVSVNAAQLDNSARQKYPLIVDEFTAIGPAAGICAAHLADPAAAWLVVACDMPLLDEATIGLLLDRRQADAAATTLLAESEDKPEPLCAIYEPATLAGFYELVAAGGSPSPRDWLNKVNTERVVVPAGRVLRGANTPDEFADLTGRSGSAGLAARKTK